MKILKSMLIMLGAFGFVLQVSSCKKEETPEPEPEPTPAPAPPASTPAPANPTPTPSDAKGVLVAIKTISSVTVPVVGTVVKQEIGLPTAFFYDTPNTFLDAGVVKCNNSDLTKQTNNTYIYSITTSNPTGIDYSSGVDWSVGGNTTNNIPSFTYSPNMGYPTLDSIAGNISTVTKANGVTIAATNTITNADSVIFGVYGPSGNAMVTKPGNTSSYTFSASELSSLGSGFGYIQIAAYKIKNNTFSGKKYYFINEAVFTKSVSIN